MLYPLSIHVHFIMEPARTRWKPKAQCIYNSCTFVCYKRTHCTISDDILHKENTKRYATKKTKNPIIIRKKYETINVRTRNKY